MRVTPILRVCPDKKIPFPKDCGRLGSINLPVFADQLVGQLDTLWFWLAPFGRVTYPNYADKARDVIDKTV